MRILFRAQLRRDKWQLLWWILGSGLFAIGSAAAVTQEFGSEGARRTILVLASGNPALLAIRGIPNGSSPGAFIYFEVFTYIAVLACLMTTFLVVRHTRGDEEAGRAELIGSTPVERTSALYATLLLAVLANVAFAVVVALGFAAAGLPIAGSILTGVAAAGAGLAFAGVAAIAAQVSRTSRAANSIAGSLVGLAFVLRAIGDALGSVSADGLHVTSSWLSWLSPIGWGQQTGAFATDNAAPVLLDVAFFAVAAGIAVALARSRDIGSGLIGERAGRATASASLRGSFGLAWRLQRNGVIGWAVGAAALGLFAGGLAGPAVEAVSTNKDLAAVVRGLIPGGTSGIFDTFIATIMAYLGILAASAAIQAVLRARTDEAEGRAELVLAAAVDRGQSLLNTILVAALSIVIVLAAGGLTAGITLIAVGHADKFGGAVEAAAVQLPAAAIFAAVAALLFAVLPRLTIGLGWALFAFGFIFGQFGALFKLPEWVRNASPFTHTPVIPGSDIDWAALVIMAAIAVVLAGAGVLLARTRDLVT